MTSTTKSVSVYLRDRFPVFPLLLYCIFTIVGVNSVFGEKNFFRIILLGFIYLGFLFHLRVLDEFKDYKYDLEFHSDRPVQKGLLKLKELKYVEILNLIFIMTLTLLLFKNATLILVVTLLYTVLMYKDFFVSNFSKRNYILYFLLNELVFVFLFTFFFSSLNDSLWFFKGIPDLAIFLYLIIPIMLIEIGRKIKHRTDSKGNLTNDTYAFLWGQQRTIYIFSLLVTASGAISFLINDFSVVLSLVLVFAGVGVAVLGCFAKEYVVKNSMLITTFLALTIPLLATL